MRVERWRDASEKEVDGLMADASIDWAALYQKHRDAMFRVAKGVLRSSGRVDLADDAVQDAMVSLMKSPPTEPPPQMGSPARGDGEAPSVGCGRLGRDGQGRGA